MHKLFERLQFNLRKFLSLRSNWFKLALILSLAVIVVRLFQVQVLQHDKYVAEAQEQQTMQNVILAKRGEIYMLDGMNPVPLVMNTKVWSVVLDPQVSRASEDKVEKKIDEIASKYKTASWEDVFKSTTSRYYVVATNLPYDAAEAIKEADLPGVYLKQSAKRVYPEGEMASGLLGFVNADGVGQYGIEGAFNSELSGTNGVLKTVKDVNNIPLTIGDQNVKIPAVDGNNIVLTIDQNIQNKTEEVMKKSTEDLKISHATALVMEPATGKILAMVGIPNYDASNYGKVEDASIFQTNATMDAFEPASVCKTFTFSTAINEGKMTPETTFNNTDTIYVDGWPISNATKGYTGSISMQTGLSHSLNTSSTTALMLLGGSQSEITYQGKQMLYDYYYNKFWLGRETGIEIAENAGIVINPDDERSSNARYANMTFGQGLNITLLQVAAAYSSVINGGEYYKPTLVAGMIDENGNYVAKKNNEMDHRTISEETSKTMRQMLHTVRQLYATERKVDGDLYTGGKTGTGQVVKDGKYVMDETVGTYVGFGAKDENTVPEYLVAIKIWESGRSMQGQEAREIFNNLSPYIADYLRVKM